MSVTVQGRVPKDWNDQTVAHLTSRLQALEKAAAGGSTQFTSPAYPPFGSGVPHGGGGPSPGGDGGSGGGGVTDHGALSGLQDDDHPQYIHQGEQATPLPHPHAAEEIAGLDQFRRKREGPIAHTHRLEDIQGLGVRQPAVPLTHAHVMADVGDLRPDDSQFVLASRIFGG